VDKECSTHGRDGKYLHVEKLKGSDQLRDLGILFTSKGKKKRG
jgi:hypothetical protein